MPVQQREAQHISTFPRAAIPADPIKKVAASVKGKQRIDAKLKAALDLMVFGPAEGEDRCISMSFLDAAKAVAMAPSAIRAALEKPHVQRYLRAQKQVFRAAASARNISRLDRLADDSSNAMAQLGAIRLLERMDEDEPITNGAKSPGFTLIVVNQSDAPAGAKVIEHVQTPAIGDDALNKR